TPPYPDPRAERRRKRDEILNPTLRASGICGSGIIEAIAELFKAGVVAPNGRFVTVDHPRLRTGLGDGGGKAEFILAWPHETSTGREIAVHSDDIRAIQLGKAALYAGTKLLMNRLELPGVDKIVLAGGFGSYIDPVHAMILGLIPDCDLRRVQAVGNAAGDGARMILLDKNKRMEAQTMARWVTYIETAVEPAFQDEFVGALDIPHAGDAFPHLETILSEAKAQWTLDRVLAFESMANNGRSGRVSREDREARRTQRTQRRASVVEN
ncbi:MAG: ATP-binding protein, partial [Chloroflexota bacterium]|nr:ATP-binding protein [Chloroflexota bacterium]